MRLRVRDWAARPSEEAGGSVYGRSRAASPLALRTAPPAHFSSTSQSRIRSGLTRSPGVADADHQVRSSWATRSSLPDQGAFDPQPQVSPPPSRRR